MTVKRYSSNAGVKYDFHTHTKKTLAAKPEHLRFVFVEGTLMIVIQRRNQFPNFAVIF